MTLEIIYANRMFKKLITTRHILRNKMTDNDFINCYRCGKPTYTECLDIVGDQLLCPVCKDKLADERSESEKIIDFLINDCEVTTIHTSGHLMIPKEAKQWPKNE